MSDKEVSVLVVACAWIPLVASHTDWLLGPGRAYETIVLISGAIVFVGLLMYIALRWRTRPNRSTRLLVSLLLMSAYGLAFVYIGLHDMAVL